MSTRHSDVLDEAAELAAALTESAVAAVRRAALPEHHPSFDGLNCIECEDEIPKERLALKKIRCIPCQEILDKLQNTRRF